MRTELLAVEDDRAFAALYTLYSALFPLPDEREPPEAFFQILELNDRADVQRLYGPWREIVAVVRQGEGGPIVGGHVFGATTSRAHVEFGCLASVQGIYTFFDKSVRGRCSMADIRRYFETQALSVFELDAASPPMRPLIFIEVNNPLRMSAREIAQDTRSSGVDPHRRYAFWKRSGFRPLDFPYVQPSLRPDAKPVRYLDLFCSGDAASIPAPVIANHLRAFVSVSVLKARPADEDADFAAMREWLAAREAVSFVPAERADQQAISKQGRASSKSHAGGEAAQ